MNFVTIKVGDRHVTFAPRFILRSQDDRDATRRVFLMKQVHIIDFSADREPVFLPIMLVQGEFTRPPADPGE